MQKAAQAAGQIRSFHPEQCLISKKKATQKGMRDGRILAKKA
jgi:hypothetical protein